MKVFWSSRTKLFWLSIAAINVLLAGCSAGLNQAQQVLETATNSLSGQLSGAIDEQVSVTGGEIRGNTREGGLREYLGVPYASPPLGEKRWQPPHPVEDWAGVRDASTIALPCYQPNSVSSFYDRSYTQMSEDCLTLNVWTRAEKTDEALPVMFWVHGGALVMGSGRDYDGAPLTDKGVVLVTINYRLGPFGFFAHPELSAESDNNTSGNQGFHDQIAALQWVQKNIQKFGGDPNNVTIFGESAGSWSMSVLQASPLARGLFHKVIGQSGARFIPLSHRAEETYGLSSAEDWGEKLAGMMSGSGDSSLAALRALDAQAINAIAATPEILNNFDRLTIVDGAVLPDEVNTIFASGNQADVPVLIGSNADEATTFDPALSTSEEVDYTALLKATVTTALPKAGEDLYELYPSDPAQARDSWTRLMTDMSFTQPMRLWADHMENAESPAYLYWWNWRPTIEGSDKYGAFHAAEIPYVFGNTTIFNIDDSAKERAFSETMMTLWTSFAKSGKPSVEGLAEWPAYATDNPVTAVLGAELTLDKGVRSAEIKKIQAAYDAMRAQ